MLFLRMLIAYTTQAIYNLTLNSTSVLGLCIRSRETTGMKLIIRQNMPIAYRHQPMCLSQCCLLTHGTLKLQYYQRKTIDIKHAISAAKFHSLHLQLCHEAERFASLSSQSIGRMYRSGKLLSSRVRKNPSVIRRCVARLAS